MVAGSSGVALSGDGGAKILFSGRRGRVYLRELGFLLGSTLKIILIFFRDRLDSVWPLKTEFLHL